MASSYHVRRQPCSRCGGTVVIVETSASALGGLLRRRPSALAQHSDYEPGSGRVDAVDGACRRAEQAGEPR